MEEGGGVNPCIPEPLLQKGLCKTKHPEIPVIKIVNDFIQDRSGKESSDFEGTVDTRLLFQKMALAGILVDKKGGFLESN